MRLGFGEYVLNLGTRQVFRASEEMPLSPKAFQLLELLALRRPDAVSKEELHKALWPNTFVTETNLANLVNELRTAFGDVARQSHVIRTVQRFGYAFQATAEPLPSTRPREGDEAGGLVSSGLPRPPLESIAVLPFENVSGDPDAEYLCDGIAESIIHRLSRLRRLRVMARSTLSRYKGREIDPRAVGKELKVRAVLTGRVLHKGNRLVIKTELADVSDGSQVWGANFNRKFSDILAIEDEISGEISDKLRLHVTSEEEERLTRRATQSPEAYRLYIQGRFHGDKRTVEGLRKAMALFRQSIELDPAYALPYAGIAESYNFLGFYTHLPPGEAFPKAKAAATRALELDHSLAEARAMRAIACFFFERNWASAEKEYRLATEANPGYAGGHQYYGLYLSAMGRVDEALEELHLADELDPLLLPGKTSLAWGLHMAHRNDEAIDQLHKTLAMDPAFIPAENVLSWCYLQKGMWTEATQAAQRAVSLSGRGTFYLTSLGQCLAASGHGAEAEAILVELAATSPARYVSAVHIALIHLALGQTDRAFAFLEKAFTERAWGLAFLLVEPKADPLRADPRFGVLMHRIGFSASAGNPQA